MKKNLLPLVLLAAAGCTNPSTPASAPAGAAPTAVAPTDSLQKAVATYIEANKAEFPGYEPVKWGRPVVYTRQSEAAIKGVVAMKVFDDALVPRNKALANYKASLARHDPPARNKAIETVYGKANKYNDSLLVIANKFIGVKDTTRLGTQLLHTYRRKDNAGALVLDSANFVVYPGGKVELL
ncbi:hypothetical protein [Hymenobacter psoromatis]|uniref:hypothetical protein n=1 Tax=Hymenobacter psoromatis TaxID=1484116 RepID=UPI001CBAA8C6|nr:hypothetical protein [Hymenobacter psoromatis]